MVLETALKDAAIQKNGIVKVWWDDAYEATVENYEGKTIEEVAMLDEDPDFVFQEATAKIPGPDGEYVDVEEQPSGVEDDIVEEFDINSIDLAPSWRASVNASDALDATGHGGRRFDLDVRVQQVLPRERPRCTHEDGVLRVEYRPARGIGQQRRSGPGDERDV